MEFNWERLQNSVLQMVVCQARAGVTDEQMMASADAIMPTLRQSAAFLHREFRKTDEGRWIDCLWWSSFEEGNAVGMSVHATAEGRAMFELIEESVILYNCLPGRLY